ncbi:SICA antigen, partial [Plasmodium coatneyi]
KLLWEELKTFTGDMMFNIEKDGQQDQKMCEKASGDNAKELCRLLLRIFFWMDGLKQQVPNEQRDSTGHMIWIRRDKETDVKKEEEQLHSYYRCLIGKVTLVKMLGKHCKLKVVADVVMNDVGKMRKTMNLNGGNQLCNEVDFGSLKLGSRFMWDQIKKRINDFSTENNYGVWLPLVQKGHSKLHTIRDEVQDKGICPNGEENLDKDTLEKLEITVYNDEDLSLDDDIDTDKDTKTSGKELEELLAKAKQEKEAGKEDKEEEFLAKTLHDLLWKKFEQHREEVQSKKKPQTTAVASPPTGQTRKDDTAGDDDALPKVKQPPSNPAPLAPSEPKGDEECSHLKDDMCKRAKCVTTNWFKDRITRDGGGKQNWCTFWNNDVKGRLDKLSEAMIHEKTGDDGICKDIEQTGKEDAQHAEAKRKACEYIVKGLKHIYNSQEHGTDLQKKNNQQFDRTMGCILLNAYADKLKEEAQKKNPPCDVEKGIDHAFTKSGDIKEKTLPCKGDSTCVECTRKENLTCTLNVNEQLFDEGESKKCEIGRSSGRTQMGTKVKEMLSGNAQIQRTLKSICRDCSKEGMKLCERLQCITENWFEDRIYGTHKRTWCVFWNDDAKSRLNELSEAVTTNSESMGDECKNIQGKDASDDDANKKACQFITAGLKGIYELQESTTEPNRKIARNNRLTSQTMYCLFLNAYADKLIKEVRRPCNITEETIKSAFQIGNRNKETWCLDKNTKEKNDCVECKREANFSNCPLNADNDLRRQDSKCDQDKDNIEKKVKEVFENGKGDKEKGPQIKKALTALTNINNINNTLCDRVKCIYHRWGENRKVNGYYEDWKKFWDPDVQNRLNALSNVINEKNTNMEQHCKDLSGASKQACQLITAGLKRIYEIERGKPQEGNDKEKEERKIADNLIFHRTFSCMLLNIFADEMEEKCLAKQQDIKAGIQHAFSESAKIKEQTHPCKTEGDLCPFCERKEDYKTCSIKDKDGETIGDRMKKMLLYNGQIKQALSTIDSLCKPPAATKPATTSQSGSQGRSESSGSSAPPAGRAETSGNSLAGFQQDTKGVKGKSTTANCGNGVVDGGMDAADACLGFSNNDIPVSNTYTPDPDEADAISGPKGVLGSEIGNVAIVKGKVELPTDPLPTGADPGSQTIPTTGQVHRVYLVQVLQDTSLLVPPDPAVREPGNPDPLDQVPLELGTQVLPVQVVLHTSLRVPLDQVPQELGTQVLPAPVLLELGTQVLLVPAPLELGIQVLLVPVLQEPGTQVLPVQVQLVIKTLVVQDQVLLELHKQQLVMTNHWDHLHQGNHKDHHNKGARTPWFHHHYHQQQQHHHLGVLQQEEHVLRGRVPEASFPFNMLVTL